jgi:beta-glucanase (GH16 family)
VAWWIKLYNKGLPVASRRVIITLILKVAGNNMVIHFHGMIFCKSCTLSFVEKHCMKSFVACLLVCLFFRQGNIPVNGYELIWQDEFNGNLINRSIWNFRSLGKRGDAVNVPEAARLDGKGNLLITASYKNNQLQLAMLHTENRFATTYGYFECRAALTKTAGLWAAFWLQSSTNGDNGTPQTHGAEIDIFEYFYHHTKDSVAHTLHWGGYGPTHRVAGPVWSALKKTPDGFHTFGLEWTAGQYTTFVDGVATHTERSNISHRPEFIILSLEANRSVAGPVNFSSLPDTFAIDYVRVYKKRAAKP